MSYIKAVRAQRARGSNIYYLDESYCNGGICPNKLWFDKTVVSAEEAERKNLSTGPKLPSGLGERIILLGCGGNEGFLPVGQIYISKQGTENDDYHGDVDSTKFKKWLLEILHHVPKGSTLVMDNASYHCSKVLKITYFTSTMF